MRFILSTALLIFLLPPSQARAAVDFKCESMRQEDQLGGWVSFGMGGRNGHVILEYWNSYPPITLVDADLDNGSPAGKRMKFTAEADRATGAVATLNLEEGAYAHDKFVALLQISGRNGTVATALSCVRH